MMNTPQRGSMINKYFPHPLIVRFIDGNVWELMRDFEYYPDEGDVIEVPHGFVFDFASIPRIFWSFIGSPTGKYGPAALIHDYLYFTQTVKRHEADKIFYTIMRILGISRWRRSMMYFAVRLAGWKPWNKRRRQL